VVVLVAEVSWLAHDRTVRPRTKSSRVFICSPRGLDVTSHTPYGDDDNDYRLLVDGRRRSVHTAAGAFPHRNRSP
jgi:hypothetical protein